MTMPFAVSSGVNKVGGSLSKNDHWYIQQAFGLGVDPGEAPPTPGIDATGGTTTTYTDPNGDWKSHCLCCNHRNSLFMARPR